MDMVRAHDKEVEQSHTRTPTNSEGFVRGVAKIAVAQVFESQGFHGFQPSALEALADVAIRYITEVGKTANLAANSANRSECNVFDVIYGLEDLSSIQGFPGASDIHRSLATSGIVKEISEYVGLEEEIPFLYSLPKFPVFKECAPFVSMHQLREETPGEHIPAWLPPFPRVESNVDGEEGKYNVVQKEELPLMSVQQGFGNNGSLAVFGMDHLDPSKMKKAVEVNPFFAPPLSYGEKEISFVDHHHLRFLDGQGFTNYGNMMGGIFSFTGEEAPSKLSDVKEGDGVISSGGRPTVQLKFNSVRKLLPKCRNVIAQRNIDEKLANYFGDDEKEETKQKAELILKESMENQMSPAQL